jgi:CheY-specific phosphatase CheX
MSYAKSQTSVPTELSDALQAALIEVSENAYFVFVEPCEPGQFAALVRQVSPQQPTPPGAGKKLAQNSQFWLRSSVSFTGASSGLVEIVLPERLACWLVTSLLGMSPDEEMSETQIFDGVGEFTNMVCGAWLSNLSEQGLFTLKVPDVTRMPPTWTPLGESLGSEEQACRMVCLNDMPLRVRVRW